MTDFISKEERMSNIERPVLYTYATRRKNGFDLLAVGALGVAIGMILLVTIKACVTDSVPQTAAYRTDCSQCHSHNAALTKYFKQSGSKTPEVMANAVLNTKSPRLLAAISTVESGGNPHLRNTGYKNRHSGAYQVNPKYWGKVPTDATGQALQAESILIELTQTMPIKKALSVYGGDSTSRYQRTVLAELERVP